MPQFDLKKLFQSVSLLSLACGIAALIARLPEGPWLIFIVLVIPFLIGAAIGTLFDRAVFGGALAVIAAFPVLCFMWLVVNMLGGIA